MLFNWIDWLLVLVGICFVWTGWVEGLLKLVLTFLTFLGTLWTVVRLHGKVGEFINHKFGIGADWGEALGYLGTAVVVELMLAQLVDYLYQKLPDKWWRSRANRFFGAGVSLAQAGAIMTFILLVTFALPVGGSVKRDIKNSAIASKLVILGERYGGQEGSALDLITQEAVKFLTVKPGTLEKVTLPIQPLACHLRIDTEAEAEMLRLVNLERAKRETYLLTLDTEIVKIARAYAWDMFERRFFSHVNPEGQDVADRMKNGGVVFTVAGENLAYARDIETAHKGLMDSPGHKRNILESRFGRVGIGVVDGGICGMMFTQNFAN